VKRRRWLWALLLPLLGIAWFLFRWATTYDFLVGPPKPQDLAVEPGAPAPAVAPAAPAPRKSPAPSPTSAPRASAAPPAAGLPGGVATAQPVPQEAPQPAAPALAAAASSAEEVERFPLSPDGIRAAVEKAKPELIYCYESWVMIEPELEGTLRVAMHLASDGGTAATVTQIQVMADAGMGHIAFEGCVLSALSELQFEPGDGRDLEVHYPLSFATKPAPR